MSHVASSSIGNLLPLDEYDLRFRGLVLPLEKKPGGIFQTAFCRDIIRSSIIMILMTRLGERVMLPEFGSNLWKLVFEPNDVILRSLAEEVIIGDLARWEPRVRVTAVLTRTDDTADELNTANTLQISVTYEIVPLSVEEAVTLVFRRQLET